MELEIARIPRHGNSDFNPGAVYLHEQPDFRKGLPAEDRDPKPQRPFSGGGRRPPRQKNSAPYGPDGSAGDGGGVYRPAPGTPGFSLLLMRLPRFPAPEDSIPAFSPGNSASGFGQIRPPVSGRRFSSRRAPIMIMLPRMGEPISSAFSVAGMR